MKRFQLLQSGILRYEYAVENKKLGEMHQQLFSGIITAINSLATEIGTVLQTFNLGDEKLASRVICEEKCIMIIVSDDIRTPDDVLLLKVEILARRMERFLEKYSLDQYTQDFLANLIDQEKIDFYNSMFKDLVNQSKEGKLIKILGKLDSPHKDIEQLIQNLQSEFPASELLLDPTLIFSEKEKRFIVPAQLSEEQRGDLIERLETKSTQVLGKRFTERYFNNFSS